MEYCSRQCIRRTLYAVMIGISPIIIGLFLMGIMRLILHCLELSYNRRQQLSGRRHSSNTFHKVGRSTLSYTPVSVTELHRIIQGDYHSQQQSESSSSVAMNDHQSPQSSRLMNSILTRSQSSPPLPSNTLSNLVVRRNAINSNPFTALFAPISTSAPSTCEIINEQNIRRPTAMTIKRESVETTTLATINNNNNNNTIFYSTNDSLESVSAETDPLVTLPKTMTTTTTTTTTVVVEEFLDFHSVHSIPYSLNLVNSLIENDF